MITVIKEQNTWIGLSVGAIVGTIGGMLAGRTYKKEYFSQQLKEYTEDLEKRTYKKEKAIEERDKAIALYKTLLNPKSQNTVPFKPKIVKQSQIPLTSPKDL